MIQNLSFANHLSGQRMTLLVSICHRAELNMKNTCTGWKSSREQFEKNRMTLRDWLAGTARAVHAVQPATCLTLHAHGSLGIHMRVHVCQVTVSFNTVNTTVNVHVDDSQSMVMVYGVARYMEWYGVLRWNGVEHVQLHHFVQLCSVQGERNPSRISRSSQEGRRYA